MKIKVFQSFILVLFVSLASINALHAENEPLPTNSEDSVEAADIANMRNTLVGKWQNPFFEYKNANGSLKFHFRGDGTYTKMLSGGEFLIKEEGNWEISNDGKHLIMRSQSVCEGELTTRTQVATIKHLQLDELVLEQAVCVDGVTVSAEPKDFYFNKY